MLQKIVSLLKKHIVKNKKGEQFIGLALILLFIALAVAPYVKTLGETTGQGIDALNTQLKETLNDNNS